MHMLVSHGDLQLKLDLQVTGTLGMELGKSLPTYLHFAFSVPVFRIKIQFCKSTFEIIMELVHGKKIPFVGAYCSNHFNWSDADFELRLKISKARTPKKHSKNPLTW